MTKIDQLNRLQIGEICGIGTYTAPIIQYPIRNVGRRHSGLLYTTQGEETYTFSDQTITASPDTVLYLPRDEAYTITLSGESSTVIYFDFEPPMPSDIPPLLISVGAFPALRSAFSDAEHEWSRRRKDSVATCFSLFYKILSLLIRAEEARTHGAEYARISDAVQYLHTHYTDPDFRIGELAKISDMSVRYFEMLFLECMKRTPKEYVLQLKLDLARELLQNEKNTVTDVAARLGFGDIYHFSRTFKKKTGYTPTEYRNL